MFKWFVIVCCSSSHISQQQVKQKALNKRSLWKMICCCTCLKGRHAQSATLSRDLWRRAEMAKRGVVSNHLEEIWHFSKSIFVYPAAKTHILEAAIQFPMLNEWIPFFHSHSGRRCTAKSDKPDDKSEELLTSSWHFLARLPRAFHVRWNVDYSGGLLSAQRYSRNVINSFFYFFLGGGEGMSRMSRSATTT